MNDLACFNKHEKFQYFTSVWEERIRPMAWHDMTCFSLVIHKLRYVLHLNRPIKFAKKWVWSLQKVWSFPFVPYNVPYLQHNEQRTKNRKARAIRPDGIIVASSWSRFDHHSSKFAEYCTVVGKGKKSVNENKQGRQLLNDFSNHHSYNPRSGEFSKLQSIMVRSCC